MSYKYNPLLQQNLQKLQVIPEPPAPVYDSELSSTSENAVQNKVVTAAIEDTKNKKVSKFFTSINEIEVGEIGEYQGETNETFTRGFFYERKDAVTITELGTSKDYVFSEYLNAYIDSVLYHQQYFIDYREGLSVTQYMIESCTIDDTLISVIMFSTDFLKTNFAEPYTNWNGTFYIYPYARLTNGAITKFDYNNQLSIVNNVIYYKDQALNFTQSARGVSHVYVGMEIETHLLYMWIPLFPDWIAFALDTAQVHAAYTETWSIFKIVDSLSVSRLTPSAHVTAQDYEFTEQTPYAQVDTQENLVSEYFNLLSPDSEAILVSCNYWAYDNNNKPFPDYRSIARSIVYLKDERKFMIAETFPQSYMLKLYKWFNEDAIYYTIGGAPGNVVKEWTLDIIYPSAQSFSENDSMPINSRQLLSFRTATTKLNGLMSSMHVSQINTILQRISMIKYAYGEWVSQNVTKQFDYWPIVFPTSKSGIIIEYTFELRNVQDNKTMFFLAKSTLYSNGYALMVQHFGSITGTPSFEYRGVIRFI